MLVPVVDTKTQHSRLIIFLIIGTLGGTLGGFALLLSHAFVVLGNDWDYFNSLSLVIRSSILGYGTFPLHNPWVCGGLDLWTNPQNRIFSPSLFVDLFFAPQLANMLTLVGFGVAGILGAYKLFGYLGISPKISALMAFLFINGSWFGLHFQEGHVPYGSIQLLPLLVYLFFRIPSPKHLYLLAVLVAFILNDGGIYAVIFFMLTITTLYLFRPLSLPQWAFVKNWPMYSLAVIVSFLVASPKLVPVTIDMAKRVPSREFTVMTWQAVVWSLFYPFQSIRSPITKGLFFEAHEFGCYIGAVAVGVVALCFIKQPFFRANRRFLLFVIFWLWVATGWGYKINPWNIFHGIPLFNNAHVQSRCFIIMYLAFLVIFGRALDMITRTSTFLARPRLMNTLWLFLVIEGLCVKAYPVIHDWSNKKGVPSKGDLIQSQTISYTMPYAHKPTHYLSGAPGSASSARCYEPARHKNSVKAIGETDYKGEAFYPDGAGKVQIDRFIPGKIVLSYQASRPSTFAVNTHWLKGWTVTQGHAETFDHNGLLAVRPHNLEGHVNLVYSPWYFYPVLASFVLGICGVVSVAIWVRRPSPVQSGPFNYDDIPEGYYHEAFEHGPRIRRAWHQQKFDRVINCLPEISGGAILDIGCFAGTFLSLLSKENFTNQVGVDIVEKQITYATNRFGDDHRKFLKIANLSDIAKVEGQFDCITLIEVIEHLTPGEISEVLRHACDKLRKGGKLVLSTPNYLSFWPVVELIINRFSSISYEEQHLTKLNFLNVCRRLNKLMPELEQKLQLHTKTTTHFLTPFIAWISPSLARWLSRVVPHHRWHFPFGNLMIVVFERV